MKTLTKILSGAAILATLTTGASANNFTEHLGTSLEVKTGSINGITDSAITFTDDTLLFIPNFPVVSASATVTAEEQIKGELGVTYVIDSKTYVFTSIGVERYAYDIKGSETNLSGGACTEIQKEEGECTTTEGRRLYDIQAYSEVGIGYNFNEIGLYSGIRFGSEKAEAIFTVETEINEDWAFTASAGKTIIVNDKNLEDRNINATVGLKYSF